MGSFLDSFRPFTDPPTGTPLTGASGPMPKSGMGASFLSMLGAPGVGTALMFGATLLTNMFSAKKNAALQQFQIEVQKQESERNRAQQRSAEAQREVGRASETAIAAEQGLTQNTINALRQLLG